MTRFFLTILGIVCAIQVPALGALDITLAFTGNGISPSQALAFQTAETFWENALSGYQPGVLIPGPTIFARGVFIDGPGGAIGQGAPSTTVQQAGYQLTASGIMEFDVDDLGFLESNNYLVNVLKHEMAHVLGFGFYWSQGNLYASGSGQYIGARGLAEYRNEFLGQSSAAFVPVELGGGGGTADFHWDEVDQGAGPTGRVTTDGFDMRDELMTGWLNTLRPQFVSRTTLGQFEDIGFVANFAAVPEPSSLGLGLIAMIAGCFRRKRFEV